MLQSLHLLLELRALRSGFSELAGESLNLRVKGINVRDVVLVAKAADGIGGGLVVGTQAVVMRGGWRRMAIRRVMGRRCLGRDPVAQL